MIKVLRRIMQEFNAAPNLAQALAQVVSNIVDTLPADAVSFFLSDDVRGEYVLSATLGLNVEMIGKAKLKFGEGLIGYIGEREELLNVADASEQPQNKVMNKLDGGAMHAFIGVPIIYQGNNIGVLVAQRIEAAVFDAEAEAFLVTLAIQLSSVIAQARAKGELQDLGTRRKKTSVVLSGVTGSRGVVIGHAVVIFAPADLDAVPDKPAEDVAEEIELFESALVGAREEIHQVQIRAKATLSVAEHALFDAYLRILDSRTLMSEVVTEIESGVWAQAALRRVIKKQVLQFENLEDEYLRERAADFRDLGRRILSYLQANEQERPDYPKDTILVSDEVTPTALMEVPEGCLVGVVSGSGSGNSHVAILARAMGLPTVMGVTGTPVTELNRKELIVDGYNAQVYVAPNATMKKEFKALAEEEQQLDEELDALRDLPAETADGHHVKLFVNTGLVIDGNLSLSVGAEGVGLYRTEMPFMLRDRFPSEEEQRVMYRQLLNVFAPRPVVMRTLDIGGDKALSYFPVEEDNPFLGWRGVRITLDHPDIFLRQVRAMLKASEGLSNLSIMMPMITSVSEVESCIRLIHQAFDELVADGMDIKMPAIGIMVEVPAAVYQAVELARRVDFLSVGSNDLIQYLLAVDRNNPRVAKLYNSFHPAVLRALDSVVKAGRKANKPVSICGEMAADPAAVVLLMAMGYQTLSISARILPRVKWVVRQFTMERAKELLKEVLVMDDAVEVRCHMEMALEEAGLGGLIRAGK